MTITLHVIGTPVTQGSKRAFVVGGRAVMTESAGRRHKDWREAVAGAARQWQEDHGAGLIDGPVSVGLTFDLTRPASHPKRRRTWPIAARSGDIDKLSRAVLDAITGTILRDDAQVVRLVADKRWGDPPGVYVAIAWLGERDDRPAVFDAVTALVRSGIDPDDAHVAARLATRAAAEALWAAWDVDYLRSAADRLREVGL